MVKTRALITEYFNRYKTFDEYIEIGGFSGLKKVVENGRDFPINELKKFDLRGRGGAEFPTWRKWLDAKNRDADVKLILCNADEGEPGSYKDRDLLSKDPYKVIEGMVIAAYAIGSEKGYIYIREEYDYIRKKFIVACENAKEAGYLGGNILGAGFTFNITVHTGAGAYVCGENSALIESMQGRVGRPKLKPPRIGEKGLFDLPTMANNVETFSCVATIMHHGSEKYSKEGTDVSIGTKMVSISGNVKNPGAYEVPFGITVNELIYDIGGGPRDNSKIKFIQTGGASGPLVPEKLFNQKYTYEDFSIGAGSLVIVDDQYPLIDYLLAIQEFFQHESCGKCTPCREGLRQVVKILYRIKDQTAVTYDLQQLYNICQIMIDSSFCGLGYTAPISILSAFEHFKDELCKDIDGAVELENWED